MTSKTPSLIFVILLSLLLTITIVSAITANMGNARMILRAKPGETVERYIQVNNVNDVAININITLPQNMSKDITLKLKDSFFVLQPGEEKKAYFTISAKKDGTYENKLNVAFFPTDAKKGAGVGLQSNVILIASGNPDATEDPTETEDDPENTETDVLGGGESSFNSVYLWLLGATVVLAVIFFGLMFLTKRKVNAKKKSGRSG